MPAGLSFLALYSEKLAPCPGPAISGVWFAGERQTGYFCGISNSPWTDPACSPCLGYSRLELSAAAGALPMIANVLALEESARTAK